MPSRFAPSAAQMQAAIGFGRTHVTETLPDHDPAIAEMRANRRVNARIARGLSRNGSMAKTGALGSSELQFATGRPRDPYFYWQQNNLPYDVTKPEELTKIRALARMIYLTHPLIASAIDIFSKYPLTGMEFSCKDEALTEFYSDLMLDQLDYEEFLVDVGREYWTVGEAWPFGSFNETLGVWEADELLNPNDIDVIQSPFLKEPRFEMRLPGPIRRVLAERRPIPEYEMLIRSYPELVNYASEEAKIPVSNVLLKQVKFKADTFHPRGIPIMMRGFRSIMQEEMLNAAMDAVADRLYTPLIVAKLGASASDLGTDQPWIPNEDDVANFEEALDAALAADFRVLTHHFALDISTVFGRESMPRMEMDFDRLEDKQLQVFGMSKTMLNGADSGETYAGDALNRDLVTQLLTTFQRIIKNFTRDRMLVVAEAQEHYDFEERNGVRYPVMEEVLTIDEETGEQVIREQPKLLVPDLNFRAMNMRDETTYRQLVEALAANGVPVSMKTRLVNIPIELDDEIERVRQEKIDMAVEAQITRKETYLALKGQGLPIPDDLRTDFDPVANNAEEAQAAAPLDETLPSVALGTPAPIEAMAPMPPWGMDPMAGMPMDPQALAGAPANGNGAAPPRTVALPRNRMLPGAPAQAQRPPESDEQRAGMPRPAMLSNGPSHIGMRRHATRERAEKRLADESEPERVP